MACEEEGGECIGIGIQTEDVKEFYPKSVVVKNLSHLAEAGLEMLAEALEVKA